VLVELGAVEQRYRAVLEVLEEGVPVTEVARRYGVARQTVHELLARYGNDGRLAGLADRSSRPASCPHQPGPAPLGRSCLHGAARWAAAGHRRWRAVRCCEVAVV
jgi:leucine-zipper of insertion element IS481